MSIISRITLVLAYGAVLGLAGLSLFNFLPPWAACTVSAVVLLVLGLYLSAAHLAWNFFVISWKLWHENPKWVFKFGFYEELLPKSVVPDNVATLTLDRKIEMGKRLCAELRKLLAVLSEEDRKQGEEQLRMALGLLKGNDPFLGWNS